MHPSLCAIGWSDRVEALFQPLLERGLLPGRVVAVERGGCRVASPDGPVLCPPADVAVGDWVGLSGPRIGDVLPRWTSLDRVADGALQVLAANVDLVLIAAPADRLSPARVEREVVLAWDSGATPVVVVTKADLGPSPQLAERLGPVDVVAVSAVTGAGLPELTRLLTAPRTAVLFGPSGAGKSTLTNALLGEAALAVGEVRSDHRGRHTTTSRRLFPLRSGGCIIDMPGLRSLGLSADDSAVEEAFTDIATLGSGCRFRDCSHESEPGCVVLSALADGSLDPARLASYRKLRREAEFERRRVDPRARAAEARVWKARTKEQRRRMR